LNGHPDGESGWVVLYAALATVSHEDVTELSILVHPRDGAEVSEELPLMIEGKKALYSIWHEFFPRS